MRRNASLADLKKNLDRDDVYRYKSYRDDEPEEGQSFSLGELDPLASWDDIEPIDYYLPKWMMGSDQSGGSVAVSNHRVFIEEFGESPGVHEVYGGHGTFGVAIRIDAITDEMMERFAALEDYPILDEDALSEIETEAESEAWENWARGDFRQKLQQRFPDFEDVLDDVDDDKLFELFRDASDSSNTYWEHGDEGPSIDITCIVKDMSEDDLIEVGLEPVEKAPPSDPRQLRLFEKNTRRRMRR